MRKLNMLIKTAIVTLLLLGVFYSERANAQIMDKKDIPKGYTAIYTIEDLYGINNKLNGKYILMADIDMSETAPGGTWDFGTGWRPIGYTSNSSYNKFSGILDGNGHRITNLNIFGHTKEEFLGLFAYCDSAKIYNLGLENININLEKTGDFYCGGLTGGMQGGKIGQCYFSGTITAPAKEINYVWEEKYSYDGDEIDEVEYIIYYVDDYGKHVVAHCEDMDDLEDDLEELRKADFDILIGGIVGEARVYGGEINDCVSSIEIHADKAGGIAGTIWNISSCYVIGKVSGKECDIICPSYVAAENCYHLKTIGDSSNSTGLSNTQMKLPKVYTGFDFNKIWFIDGNSPYPYPQLRSCPQVRIESVKIKTKPKKLKYGLNDKLDLTGATLTVNYEDNYSADVPVEESMCSYKMGKGIQTVTVDYFGNKVDFDIEVGIDEEKLTLIDTIQELEVGETFTFKADYNGDGSVRYSSSNGKILNINSKTGMATAVKAGTVSITITAGELSETVDVEVKKATAQSMRSDRDADEEEELEPDFEMEVGESFKLAIKKIASKTLKSSNNKVVTINKKGKVTAKAPGTATIVIKDSETGSVADTYIILVTGDDEPDFEIEIGETMRVALKKGYSLKTSDDSVVSVSKKGSLIGMKAGTSVVTVCDKSGKEVDQYIVRVIK